MNFNRRPYLEVCSLPYQVTLTFGKSGAPENIRPQFRKLGSDKCIATLPVKQVRGKEVTILLTEKLARFGEGRYELIIQDNCCQVCDSVEIWFTADCEIVEVTGKEPKEVYDGC